MVVDDVVGRYRHAMVAEGTPSAAHRDEIAGQVVGYWVGPTDPLPNVRPVYDPTGAVLPPSGAALDAAACLDLVSVKYQWVPLSEAGRFTYAHTQGLMRGESWRFVVWGGGSRRVFSATLDASIDPANIPATFGAEAAKRSRLDRPAVRVRLQAVVAP